MRRDDAPLGVTDRRHLHRVTGLRRELDARGEPGLVPTDHDREETLPAAPAPPLALPDRTVAGVAAPGPAEAVSP